MEISIANHYLSRNSLCSSLLKCPPPIRFPPSPPNGVQMAKITLRLLPDLYNERTHTHSLCNLRRATGIVTMHMASSRQVILPLPCQYRHHMAIAFANARVPPVSPILDQLGGFHDHKPSVYFRPLILQSPVVFQTKTSLCS